MSKKIFITTPIYYVSAEPHIGSTYPTLFCDLLARFYKLDGYDVKFLTGTDEHGQKVEQSAVSEGKSPQDFVDTLSVRFREILKTLDFQPTRFDSINDSFIRTTMKEHKESVQSVWRTLVKNDWIYKGKYEGWYCISDEAYYGDDELIKNENGDLVTKSLGKKVEWKIEESYFFRLGEFQELLLNLYKKFPNLVRPDGKKTEVISFVSGISIKDYESGKPALKGTLKDLSISRNNFDWGIKIPIDTDGNELLENGDWKENIATNERHVIYVWLDALFNYITALGNRIKYKDYQDYWIDNPKKIHLVGKDILRFHSVYWPAFLLAYNYSREELFKVKNLDEFKKYLFSTVFAHGWLTNDGQKISKSLNNGIYPYKEIEWLENNFSLNKDVARDYLKYYVLTCVPFGNDGDYSRQRFIEKVNGDLANKVGNLSKRVLDLIYNNFSQEIPAIKTPIAPIDFSKFRDYIENIDILSYINGVLQIADDTNKYLEENEPWKLIKENREKTAEILYNSANNIYRIAILLQPIIPYLSSELLKGLGYNDDLCFADINNNLRINKIEKAKIIMPKMILKS